MSEDRIQRQMDFIVEQQAQFTVDIAELKAGIAALKERQERQAENIDKLTATVTTLSTNVTTLADSILSLVNVVEQRDEEMAALRKLTKENAEMINILLQHGQETDERFRRTDERFEDTDRRLKALADIVGRHAKDPDAHEGG